MIDLSDRFWKIDIAILGRFLQHLPTKESQDMYSCERSSRANPIDENQRVISEPQPVAVSGINLCVQPYNGTVLLLLYTSKNWQ